MRDSLPAASEAPRRLTGRFALLASVALLAWRYGALLLPGRALFTRDVPLFHAPLRHDLWRLLSSGELPRWNLWLNGGQPILSNPNYAAFYPPTWFGILLHPDGALGLLVVLHAGWAFAGTWKLVRQLGGRPPAAAMAACGVTVGLLPGVVGLFNFYCGLSWLPWVLWCSQRALAAPRRSRAAASYAGWSALCLAMQLFAGEPVSVLISLLALAVAAVCRGEARAVRQLAVITLFAAGLGAAQLVPTWQRLADSPRAHGIEVEDATLWSLPPLRLAEVLLPRLFGDPNRDEEALYFGWGFHDRAYPYVSSLYCGLLLAVVGLTGWRSRWLWIAAAGVLVALGRHNPLYNWLHAHLPLVSLVRYPEKMAVLLPFGLAIGGALGWQRWSSRRLSTVRKRTALAVAALLTIGSTGLAILLQARTDLAERFIVEHSGVSPPPALLARGVAYLQQQSLLAALSAVLVLSLLALASSRRPARQLLDAAALLLLLLDLGVYGEGFVGALPRTAIAVPAAIAAGGIERLYSPPRRDDQVGGSVVIEHPGFQQLLDRTQRLDPYAANLFDIGYVLNGDYDLMLTRWARHAEAVLAELTNDALARDHLLTAWSVQAVVRPRPLGELLAELRRRRQRPDPGEIRRRPAPAPWLRMVPRATNYRALPEAVAAAAADRFRVWQAEHFVCPELPTGMTTGGDQLRLTPLRLGGADLDLEVQGGSSGFLVAAITYDDGWEAMLDGEPTAVCPTALGQIGVPLPPGKHRLRLSYRDRWVPVGTAVSLLFLLLGSLVILRHGPLSR